MNVNRLKRRNNYEIYFYEILIGIYTFLYIIGEANFPSLRINDLYGAFNNLVIKLEYILLIFLIIKNIMNIPIKKILFIGFSVPIMFFSVYTIGFQLVLPYLFILAYPNQLESKNLARIIYRYMGLATVSILSMYVLGICPDNIIYRGLIARHSLGFTTPNAMANTFLFILFIYIYANWEKWTYKHTTVWLIIICYVYFYANSRASCYIGIFILLVMWLQKSSLIPKLMQKMILRLPIIIFVVNSVVTLSLTWYFRNKLNSLYYSVNTLTSGRLEYLTSFYNQYGIHFFGNKNIQTVSYANAQQSNGFLKWMGLDNSYGYIAIYLGIVMLLVWGIMYYFAQKNMVLSKNVIGAVYLILYAILGLTENSMHSIALNFSLFMFAEYLVRDHIDKKIKYKGNTMLN